MSKSFSENSAISVRVTSNVLLSDIIGKASYLLIKGSSDNLMLTNNLGRTVTGMQYDISELSAESVKGWGVKFIGNGQQVPLLKDINTVIISI